MTLREYDAKEKERLYGILRQTPSVLSLAVIFFVALTAQPSAKTFLECRAKTATLMLSDIISRKTRGKERFLLSFDATSIDPKWPFADYGLRLENLKIEGSDCIPTEPPNVAILDNPDSMHIYCELGAVTSGMVKEQ